MVTLILTIILVYLIIAIICILIGSYDTLLDTEDILCCLGWIVVLPIMLIKKLKRNIIIK